MSAPQYNNNNKKVEEAPLMEAQPAMEYAQPLPMMQQPSFQTSMTQQPTLQPYMLTSGPTAGVCATCNQMQTTRVSYEAGLCTWLSCAGLALIGCWLGCCLIPFCVDPCKDSIHNCGKCGSMVGKKSVV